MMYMYSLVCYIESDSIVLCTDLVYISHACILVLIHTLTSLTMTNLPTMTNKGFRHPVRGPADGRGVQGTDYMP